MVRVEGLFKVYGRRPVLRDINLTVEQGEIFALLGPNGAGKSTILKALVGLVFPSRGQITIAGVDIARHRRQVLSCLGFVPQRVSFPGHLTVRESLAFIARLKGVGDPEIDRAIARGGLQSVAHRAVRNLSGGTLQRLGLAQALLADPELLVLDEPTVGLDPQVSHDFRTLLSDLNSQGVTIVLSSHLLGEVERLAGRVAILEDGAIVLSDFVARMLRDPGLQTDLWLTPVRELDRAVAVIEAAGYTPVLSGSSLRVAVGQGGSPAIIEALRRAGIAVADFWTVPPALEDIFRRVLCKERVP